MVTPPLPFDPLSAHREFARVNPHCGKATFRLGDTTIVGDAEFLLPAAGHAIIAIYTEKDLTSQDFGQDFVLEGTGEHGTFRIECPHVYVGGRREPRNSGLKSTGYEARRAFWARSASRRR